MGQILRISAAMHVLFLIDMRMFHCPVQYQMRPLMQQFILLKCATSTQPIYSVSGRGLIQQELESVNAGLLKSSLFCAISIAKKIVFG